MTTIYITKYALTAGILVREGDATNTGGYRYQHSEGVRGWVSGNDVHLTAENAIARAEEMRIKKLQSLDKQIKKLSKLTFEVKS